MRMCHKVILIYVSMMLLTAGCSTTIPEGVNFERAAWHAEEAKRHIAEFEAIGK